MRERSVLFLHPSDEAYGADRALVRAATGLARRGWRVAILLSDDQPPGWVTAQAEAAGIPVRRGPLAPARRKVLAPLHLPGYLKRLFGARRWVRSQVSELAPSIVVVNSSALLAGGLIGRPRGVRVVWLVHEIVVKPRLARWLFRFVPVLSADLVISVSEAVKRNLTPHGFRKKKVVVVWNSLEPRPGAAAQRAPDEEPLVAFVGRLNRWKGYELLVKAAALLAEELPQARFEIAGDAPPGEEWRTPALRSEIERLGLTSRFELPGQVPDGASVFERATIAVVPSIWPEPFGLVTLEAMRAGTPVIATSHGASPEIIGSAGLLVPPGDPRALADAIRRLLADPGLRRQMGEAGRQRVREAFSPEAALSKLEALLAGLLATDPEPAPTAARVP